jgi:hypothetical protein
MNDKEEKIAAGLAAVSRRLDAVARNEPPGPEKIVVEWTSDGGYECGGFLNVVCLVYESVEAFYVHLDEAVNNYLAACKAHEEAHQVWQEKYGKLANDVKMVRRKDRAKLRPVDEPCPDSPQERILRDHLLSQPKRPEAECTLAGKLWDLNDFIYTKREGEGTKRVKVSVEASLPSIMRLDEWFEAKVKDD